jgi:thiol-disulfide isomerase/thioredoxin
LKRNKIALVLLLCYLGLATGCGHESHAERDVSSPPPVSQPAVSASSPAGPVSAARGKVLATNNLDIDFSKFKATFIELGADRCIPCVAMQPIMKEIAEEYADSIQVVFYDVWKDPAPARKYRIQLIPTQVFIDGEGREIHRNVGFFAKDDILKMLKDKGVL